MAKLKVKEIIVFGNSTLLDDKVNEFLETLGSDDKVEIGDIKYSITSHKIDMVKKDDQGKPQTFKDYTLVHSALIYYADARK